MIRLYSGEYLISPFVLHFGMNRCSHGCVYCFANLNNPDRRGEPADLLRIARWYERGSTCIEYELLKAGHPVLTANDSDPCAKSNAPTFAALHDASRKHGFRIVYQTRGGEPDAERRIVESEPTYVYVSLTTDRPEIAKTYEPGNPALEARMDFIRRLRSRGHLVVIGLNPLIPPWWSDIRATLKRLADMGVRHVWHQPLHLSRFQVSNMTERIKSKHEDFIAYGLKRVEPYQDEYAAIIALCEEYGFNTIRLGVSEKLGFWDDYFKLGFPFVPTLDALVRDCSRATGGRPALISIDAFTEWAAFVDQDKPRSVFSGYVEKFGRSIRNTGENTGTVKTMRDVNAYMWRREEFPTPFRINAFARANYMDGWASDDAGVPLMAVSASGFSGPEIDVSETVYLDRIERR